MPYKRYGPACPYCGGMHAPGECPMMMAPAMPYMPEPGMMPGMPGMPGMPTMPGMPSMPGMDEMMMSHTQMLEHISMRVDEIYEMLKAMQLGNAKG